MCRRAVALGLPAIAFTEHLDLVSWPVAPGDLVGYEHLEVYLAPDGMLVPPSFDVGGYLAGIERCRRTFPELTILTGTELGQPHHTGDAAARLPGFDQLERVLGSLHGLVVEGQFHEPPGLFRLWPADEVIRAYLAEVPRMLDGSALFEVVAHLDYAVRYWPADRAGVFDPSEFEDEFRHALRMIAGSGRVLEVNVGRGVRPWLVRWWREEGGRAIMFGSDAHDPAGVGHDFPAAAELAESFGFRPAGAPVGVWRR